MQCNSLCPGLSPSECQPYHAFPYCGFDVKVYRSDVIWAGATVRFYIS